jgi:hypothetical protein
MELSSCHCGTVEKDLWEDAMTEKNAAAFPGSKFYRSERWKQMIEVHWSWKQGMEKRVVT